MTLDPVPPALPEPGERELFSIDGTDYLLEHRPPTVGWTLSAGGVVRGYLQPFFAGWVFTRADLLDVRSGPDWREVLRAVT